MTFAVTVEATYKSDEGPERFGARQSCPRKNHRKVAPTRPRIGLGVELNLLVSFVREDAPSGRAFHQRAKEEEAARRIHSHLLKRSAV